MAENELKTIAALKGIGVSPGIVIGKAHVLNQQDVKEKHYKLDSDRYVSREIRRFKKAVRESKQELLGIKSNIDNHKGIGPLLIDVHIMILEDKTFVGTTIRNIEEQRINAE
ncbi:MAG: phosphoenolpyruvate-utilizing N-terminal domain-containing protein, partial [Syntrophaceae bacterium]|nr:phosphoenolpyruvate-utilizing N-terminal domain-containing protein [Syntrophaceae bacterium]